MRPGVTFPVLSTLAVNEFVLVQVAELETSLVEPSVKVTIAESFVGALPIKTLAFAGEMAKATGFGGPTVSCALPETAPRVAVTVTIPCFSVVTRPDWLTVANVVLDVVQVAPTSCAELPSE